MATESVQPKWQGKAAAKLHKTSAEQAWSLLEDFCSIQKWLPSIDTCLKLEGVEGKPGLIRYCAATLPSPTDDGEVVKWCNEKLLAIDSISKLLSYEVLDNNMGFKSYNSTIKVIPINDGDDVQHGCLIQWSFVADPIEGLSCEDFVNYLDFSLQGMSEKMDKEFECN